MATTTRAVTAAGLPESRAFLGNSRIVVRTAANVYAAATATTTWKLHTYEALRMEILKSELQTSKRKCWRYKIATALIEGLKASVRTKWSGGTTVRRPCDTTHPRWTVRRKFRTRVSIAPENTVFSATSLGNELCLRYRQI